MAEVEILNSGNDAAPDDDVLELGEAPVVETGEGGEPLDHAEEFPDTFDEEAGEETPLIKTLREKAKSDARMIREKDAQLAQLQGRVAIVRTKKPDLWEDDEINGDTEKYDAAMDAWKANEAKADEAERVPVARQNTQAAEFEQTRQAYKTAAVKLGKPDFDAAETTVVETLDTAQQSTILLAAKDPARFIYALGRSPNRLAQLSLITNPIKLAAEVARIEGARTVTQKQPANIDTPLRGSARLSTQSGDAKKDKLIDDAAKNGGDITALLDHDRDKRKTAA